MNFKGIICSDFHLTERIPPCRKENKIEWIQHQINTIAFIVDCALDFNCNIYFCGDFFDTYIIEWELLNLIFSEIQRLKQKDLNFYFIVGNHDLLYHNILNKFKGPIGLLFHMQHLFKDLTFYKNGISAAHYGENYLLNKESEIIFMHQLVTNQKIDIFDNAVFAGDLLDQYKKAKIIFTGDNHINFIFKSGNRCVINPGCITRQESSLAEYNPLFYYIHMNGEIDIQEILINDEEIRIDFTKHEKKSSIEKLDFKVIDIFDFRKTALRESERKLKKNELWRIPHNRIEEIV